MTSSSRSTQDTSYQDDQARDGKRESDLNFGVRHGPLLTYSTRVGWLFGAAHLLHSKIHGGEKPNESNVLLTCLTDIQQEEEVRWLFVAEEDP